MATNLARAQHRLKKAKTELAEVRAELLVSQGRLKESRQQLKLANRQLGKLFNKRTEEQFRRDQAFIVQLLQTVERQGEIIVSLEQARV